MQHIESLAPIRQIIAQSMSRYASVTPKGILLPCASMPYNPLPINIITYKPARTRYIDRKPVCRSLDGARSVDRKQSCLKCLDVRTCTAQIALDFRHRGVPFKLLLAFTSAKNFVVLIQKLSAAATPLEKAAIEIRVTDRKTWGEVHFDII